MPAAVPGAGSTNAQLERRVATLERLLGGFNKMFVGVSLPGADQRTQVEVLARRGGPDLEGEATSVSGAFCRVFEEDDGHLYLQGNTITGGNGGSVVIDDFKVWDSSTGAGAYAGESLYLKANITAFVEDDITQFGVELNSAELTTTLPTAHDFTVASPTGDIFREVGRWADAEFLPSGACGLSRAGGCIRDYKLE